MAGEIAGGMAEIMSEKVKIALFRVGYLPNTKLAQNMGLEMNAFGFIKVDQYRRTSIPDVFAAGDCAEKIDFATGKLSRIMLASTACMEARTAGLNVQDLLMNQIGTQPLLTASPAGYPLIKAAEIAAKMLRNN